MVTGDVFCLGLARHKVGKKARAAWMWTFGIVEVQTRQRVLENGRRFPGGAYGASIATLLQKAEVELEDFQDVTFVVRHRAPPGMAPVQVRTLPTSIRRKPIVGDRATQALRRAPPHFETLITAA